MKLSVKHYDDFIGLILYNVSKHSPTTVCSHFDLVSAGLVGLAKAIKTWDPKKSPLKNWCYRIINSEIIKCRYKNSKERPEDLYGSNEIFENIVHVNTIEQQANLDPRNPIYEKENELENEFQISKIMSILNSDFHLLSKQDGLNRKLYIDRVINGMRVIDLAKEYGMTYSSITHRISKVNSFIKSKMFEDKRTKELK
jgi:RNA polymerase sigma factor (sigma-70 family)